MNLFIKQKQTLRHIGNNLTATTGKSWGWHKLGTWINRYSLLYIRQINNKVLLYSTGNYVRSLVIDYSGKETEKGYV